MIEKLIARLFYLREISHRAHLRVSGAGSYARHMTLGGFYDAIAGHADSIAEAWMGRMGQIVPEIPFVIEQPSGDIVADIEAQRKWLDDNRGDETLAYSEIQNLIDGAVDEIDSTLYKLRFLA